MSVITDVVVVMAGSWYSAKAERLGRLMYQVHEERRGGPVSPDGSYGPIPDKIGDEWISGGGKVPGGSVWWIGLNYADMDHFIEKIGEHEEFHGVTVWYKGDFDDEPTTVVIGAPSRTAVLRELLAEIEDPAERAKTSVGSGLGWEAARDIVRRKLNEMSGEL